MNLYTQIKTSYAKASRKQHEGEKLENRKYSSFIAAAIWTIWCLVWIFISLKRGYIGIETNDDIYMNMISSGTYGAMHARNAFNNIVLGWIYVVLYKLIPGHNWNTLVQLATIFASYIVFGIWCILRNKVIKGYLISLTFMFATWETMVCRINFSKTGAIALGVGLVLLMSSLDYADGEWKSFSNRFARVVSYGFIILGGLFRKDTLIACVPFAGLMAVYLVIKYRKEALKKLIPIVAVSAVLIVAWIGNYFAYESDPEWKHYVEYNKYRAELLDYEMPTWYMHPDVYDSLGLSENDFWVFRDWMFADENVFSIDTLKTITELKQLPSEKGTISERYTKLLADMKLFIKEYKDFYVITLLSIALFIFAGRKNKLFVLGSFLFFAGEFGMLILKGRLIERTFYIVALLAMITLAFYADSANDAGSARDADFVFGADVGIRPGILRKAAYPVAIMCIAIYTFVSVRFAGIPDLFKDRVYDKTNINAILEYAHNNPDNLYVIDGVQEGLLLIQSFSPFDNMADVHYENLAYMGGWQVPTPATLDLVRPYGNPYNVFELLATKDNVLWISVDHPDCEEFPKYMEEHYGKSYTIIDQFGRFYICSF